MVVVLLWPSLSQTLQHPQIVTTSIREATREVTSVEVTETPVTTKVAEEAADGGETNKTMEVARCLVARVHPELHQLSLSYQLPLRASEASRVDFSIVSGDARCQKLRYYNSSGGRQSVRQQLDFRNQPFDISSLPPQLPHRLRDMKKEQHRLESFDFGDQFTARQHVSVKELAADGFYYLLEADRVKCAFCKGVLRDWEKGESPREAHRVHYSTCPFVLHLQVGNVPLEAGDAESRQPAACSEDADAGALVVQGDWSRRLGDTRLWPVVQQMDGDPGRRSLARAPPQPQAKVPPLLAFLREHQQQQQQQQQPALPVAAAALAEAAEAAALANLDSLQQKYRTDEQRQQQRQPQYRSLGARKASLQSLAQRQSPALLLAKSGFCLVDSRRVCCFFCGLEVAAACHTDPWVLHARYSPRCGHVLRERGAEFVRTAHSLCPPAAPPVASDSVAMATSQLAPAPNLEFRVEPRDIKARADLPLVRLMSQLSFTQQEVRTAVELRLRSCGEDFANGEIFFEDLMRQHRLVREATQDDCNACKVCRDREANVVLLPCRHLCSCSICSVGLRTCPVCRGLVARSKRCTMGSDT